MKVGRTSIALVISTVFIGAPSLTALAQNPTTNVVASPGKVKATATAKETFAVLSIDSGSRDVLLMGQNGKLHTVNVPDDVRNFDQMRVGDQVTVEYTEAVSLQLKKPGFTGPPASAVDAAARAPVGARPGAAVGRKVTALADVSAVDTKKQTVTLRGPMGNEWDLAVQDPAQLKNIKVGDKIEATYTEAFAISVQATPRSQSSQ